MGYIVVIEGTDGSGKQTQAQLLFETLKKANKKVYVKSFPNYESPSSGPVKMYLSGEFGDANSLDAYQASSLFAVDRLCTFKKELEKLYNDNYFIILDRYVPSNMIHQTGKIREKEERDKFLEWLSDFEYNTLKLPKPDKIFFLDMPVEMSENLSKARAVLKNGADKDVHEQDDNHLKNAYHAGLYVANKFDWTIINCLDNQGKLRTREEIASQIFNLL